MSKSEQITKERTLTTANCGTVYEYPESMLNQDFFCHSLSSSVLINPHFISPLKRLLGELKRNGSNVEACQIELKALRKSLKEWEKFANKATVELLELRFKSKP